MKSSQRQGIGILRDLAPLSRKRTVEITRKNPFRSACVRSYIRHSNGSIYSRLYYPRESRSSRLRQGSKSRNTPRCTRHIRRIRSFHSLTAAWVCISKNPVPYYFNIATMKSKNIRPINTALIIIDTLRLFFLSSSILAKSF